jgi:4'-phosphopantetheinyl transferase
LTFQYGEQGKPALPDSGISFNLSHSAGQAVYAITREAEIGVDIEQVRPLHNMQGIARRFFAASEIEQLQQYQPDEATVAFFRCWSRKECYMKAVGKGLSMPLCSFAVSLEAATARLLYPAEASRQWHLKDLAAPAGFVACLAINVPIKAVHELRAEEVSKELI